ncbi:MAG: hypothetical protein JNL28_09320 [Planctomycetes bacterium]|nr:hypothetical protein [Planctomycetota bacterium]
MHARILSGVVLLAFSLSAGAQNFGSADVNSALRDWRARHGSSWSTAIDEASGRAQLVYGGRAEWPGQPITDEEWVARAQVAIDATRGLHGVDVATLVSERVTLLPLGWIGSGDKWSVEFRQEIGGVHVEGGEVVALFDARGGLLSIQTHALTDAETIEVEPLFSAADARDQAQAVFAKEFGAITTISVPKLMILRVDQPGRRVGRLAWEIDVQQLPVDAEPKGRTYWVDARSGHPLRDETNIHFFDISGTISTLATPGTRADTAANPETAQGVKYLRIQHSGGTTFTDAAGNFTIPGAVAPESVTLSYSGLFGTADDQPTGIPHSEVFVLNPGAGNAVLMNSAANDAVTAQANIFNHVSTVRDYVRRIIPSDATADIVFVGHANIASTCNAFYNGSSINFYAAGGSCNNTAFSTVVAHEQGHWLNVRYGTNNGSDGMGEGNADVFALYAFDTPLNGEGFFTSGGAVRTGTNTRQFCGDCNPACYGEVHRDGEPWMGAAWKVRVNLNNSLGNTLGDLAADTLFMSWLNAYNQREIRSIIELQWLILDDNDANLQNGTPHAADIKNGFRAQGFPGYEIEFASVSTLADSACEAPSYPVTVSVNTLQATTIASVRLSYRVNGGAWVDKQMSPTGGSNWSGQIPYVVSPATVDYQVLATDSAGNTRPGFCGSRTFFIGQVVAFASDNMESNGAWVTGSVGDTANSNNDWQRGVPQGKSGTSSSVPWADPSVATSGTSCRGNDLGLNGLNGAYQSDVHNYLLSPVFNCSGQTGVNLIFKRWLTVEKSEFDIARVLVNNTEVWRNPFGAHLLDTSWTTQSIDISALADNNPAVTIQFELQSDGGLNLGGWQIDDLALGRIERAPQCTPIQSFCAGDGSLATACPCGNFGAAGHGCSDALAPQGGLLAATGTVNPDTLVLTSSALPAFALGVYLQQDGLNETVFQNGVMCAGGNLIRLKVRAAVNGSSTLPNASDTLSLSAMGIVSPGSGARRYYSLWYRGGLPAFCSPAAANLTNGVMVTW